jgi:hypothetical protein
MIEIFSFTPVLILLLICYHLVTTKFLTTMTITMNWCTSSWCKTQPKTLTNNHSCSYSQTTTINHVSLMSYGLSLCKCNKSTSVLKIMEPKSSLSESLITKFSLLPILSCLKLKCKISLLSITLHILSLIPFCQLQQIYKIFLSVIFLMISYTSPLLMKSVCSTLFKINSISQYLFQLNLKTTKQYKLVISCISFNSHKSLSTRCYQIN